MLSVVHDRRKLRHLERDLIGDAAPLDAGGFRGVLGEGSGDEGGDHSATALAGMGRNIPLKMDAAALPGGAQQLRHRWQ